MHNHTSRLAELMEEQLLVPAVCHTSEMTPTFRGGYFHLQNTFTVFPPHHHFKWQPAHSGGRPVYSTDLWNFTFSTKRRAVRPVMATNKSPSFSICNTLKIPIETNAYLPVFFFFFSSSVLILCRTVWATPTHLSSLFIPRVVIYKHRQGRHTQYCSGSTRNVGRSAINYLMTFLNSFLYVKIKYGKCVTLTTAMQSSHSGVCTLYILIALLNVWACMCLCMRNKEKLMLRKTVVEINI